jgi:peroxiredoxin
MKPARYVAATVAALAIGVGAYLSFDAGGLRGAAPQVSYTLLDGTKSDTTQLRGKVVLMNFWATTCSVCMQEMPEIVATHEKFKARGYETLSVAMSYDPPASVVRYAETRKLPFGVAIDNTGAIAKTYGNVKATPTTYLINRRGEIVQHYVGAPDFAKLHALVDKLLAET